MLTHFKFLYKTKYEISRIYTLINKEQKNTLDNISSETWSHITKDVVFVVISYHKKLENVMKIKFNFQ